MLGFYNSCEISNNLESSLAECVDGVSGFLLAGEHGRVARSCDLQGGRGTAVGGAERRVRGHVVAPALS